MYLQSAAAQSHPQHSGLHMAAISHLSILHFQLLLLLVKALVIRLLSQYTADGHVHVSAHGISCTCFCTAGTQCISNMYTAADAQKALKLAEAGGDANCNTPMHGLCAGSAAPARAAAPAKMSSTALICDNQNLHQGCQVILTNTSHMPS